MKDEELIKGKKKKNLVFADRLVTGAIYQPTEETYAGNSKCAPQLT